VADRAAAAYASAILEHATGRLADLGCGEVPLFGMYRDLVTDVLCVDWPNSLHGGKYVDVDADLNEPLDLDPGAFDTVIATDVIEHLHTPQSLFDSASRALRPGGKLIVGVPFLYGIHEAPHDYHRYTPFALERMATTAGLVPCAVTAIGGAPEVLVDVAMKTAGFWPFLARLIHAVGQAGLALPPIRRLSVASSRTMAMGYVLVAENPHKETA
jgi:SAM-dependent methyltransferase